MDKLTYKDFKIDQTVTCVKFDDNDFYDQHLTIGKNFPDKICIFSDNEKIHIFMPIEFFTDIKYLRKLKLEKLENVKK